MKFPNIRNLLGNMSKAEQAEVVNKAKQLGLTPVYHGTRFDPYDIINYKKTDDALYHVSPYEDVAKERLRQIEKDGTIMPLFAKVENPLSVGDMGSWSARDFAENGVTSKILDAAEKKRFMDIDANRQALSDEYLTHRMNKGLSADTSSPIFTNIEKQLKKLEMDKSIEMRDALKKRGYDALSYGNDVEIPIQHRPEHERLAQAFEKANLRGDSSKENKALLDFYDKYTKSYALFPDTPIRRIDATFDPKKIKTDPNNLLAGVGGAAIASSLMPDKAEAATNKPKRFSNVLKLLSPEQVDTLSQPSVMDEYIKNTDPEQYADIEKAKRIKEGVDMGMGLAGSTKLPEKIFPGGKWAEDVYKHYTEPIDISFLKQFRGNSLGKTDINKLKESIAKEGLNEPLILSFDPDMKKIKLGEGNHRLRALEELGYTKAPVRAYRSSGMNDDMYKPVPMKPSTDKIIDTYYPADMKPSDIVDFDRLFKK